MASSPPARDDRVPVKMTVRQWQIIDGTMDNTVSVEAENGDPDNVVEAGRSIREAGWDQVAHWTPGVPGSGKWPPDNQMVTVTLTRGQWALAASSLDRWADIKDPEDAAVSRAICDLVRSQAGISREAG
jgi:hypothetical protein